MSETLIEQSFCRKFWAYTVCRARHIGNGFDRVKKWRPLKTKVQFPTFPPNENSHWQMIAALELDHVEHDDYQCKCGTLFQLNASTSKPVHPKTIITRNRGMFQGCYWMTPTPRVSVTSSQRTEYGADNRDKSLQVSDCEAAAVCRSVMWTGELTGRRLGSHRQDIVKDTNCSIAKPHQVSDRDYSQVYLHLSK